MSTSEEATINPDGTTSFSGGEEQDSDIPLGEEEQQQQQPPDFGGGDEGTFFEGAEETLKEAAVEEQGIDPAIYLLIGALVLGLLFYFFVYRKQSSDDADDFFGNLDGEKFNLKLPTEVEEYYKVKAKCEAAGWEPGPPGPNPSGPHRMLAQALMKRAIADIPLVTQIQKESSGMNKLYSQSMCSVNQWRAYQAAEALVSSEVDEVRAEADEIEPGWSNAIWRQAMQYHQMLKQKHEMEAKAAEEQANKRKQVEEKVMAAKKQVNDKEAQEEAARKAAEELIKEEEREKESKKSFGAGGSMKKGFLSDKKGKKK